MFIFQSLFRSLDINKPKVSFQNYIYQTEDKKIADQLRKLATAQNNHDFWEKPSGEPMPQPVKVVSGVRTTEVQEKEL